MPSKSMKQHRTMQAIAHGWIPPKAASIKVPRKVAEDFVNADKREGKYQAKKGK